MKNNFSLTFLGDIAFFNIFEKLSYRKEITNVFTNFVNTVGNFEFVIPKIANRNYYDVPMKYKCSYNFLKQLEINAYAYSLANNHIMDYGFDGLIETKKLLEEKGIKVFGIGKDGYNVLELEENNIKVCVLSCVKKGRWSRDKNTAIGPDEYNPDLINAFIKENKDKFDHIIIFPHWGSELVDIPSPNDVFNARKFIDEGASAVIGHHPHIIQGIEYYRNRIIAYSLGSFLYAHDEELGYQTWQKKRFYSIALEITFSKESIESHEIKFYNYNKATKLPEIITEQAVKNYFTRISRNISNKKMYYFKKYTLLGWRELISFFIRFKKSPKEAINHYKSYLLNGR